MTDISDNWTEEDLRAELESSRQPPIEHARTTIAMGKGQWVGVSGRSDAIIGNFYLVAEISDDYLGDLPDLLGDQVLSINSKGADINIGTVADQILLSKLTGREVVEDWCDTLNSKVIKVPIFWSDILEGKVYPLCTDMYLTVSLYAAVRSHSSYNGRLALQYDSYPGTKTHRLFNNPQVRRGLLLSTLLPETVCIILTKPKKRPYTGNIDGQEINIIDMDNGCYLIPIKPSIHDMESCAQYLCSRLDPDRLCKGQNIEIFDEDGDRIYSGIALTITYSQIVIGSDG